MCVGLCVDGWSAVRTTAAEQVWKRSLGCGLGCGWLERRAYHRHRADVGVHDCGPVCGWRRELSGEEARAGYHLHQLSPLWTFACVCINAANVLQTNLQVTCASSAHVYTRKHNFLFLVGGNTSYEHACASACLCCRACATGGFAVGAAAWTPPCGAHPAQLAGEPRLKGGQTERGVAKTQC